MAAVLAVVVIRDGVLPAGGDEAIAECGGRALLVGTETEAAARQLAGITTEVRLVEAGAFRPGEWAAGLGALLADEPAIVLPASADGRDLAPRLAFVLRRPLFAHAAAVSPERIELIRGGESLLHTLTPPVTFVATLQQGLRGVAPDLDVRPAVQPAGSPTPLPQVARDPIGHDAAVVATVAADAATVDLSESPRIVAGGAGLDGPARFTELADLGVLLGAGVGATRVITDRGWIGHERQIGTTGVVVDPDLYLSFGISGAVQHTSGLGTPAHVISVNTDAHCPMMALSDLAVVADANATLHALVELLSDRGERRAAGMVGSTSGG